VIERKQAWIKNLLRCRTVSCLAAALLCAWSSVAQGQELQPTSLGLFRASAASSRGSSAGLAQPGLFAAPAVGQAGQSRNWFETTAADLVTSLLAVSDMESYDENPAGGLRFEHYNAAAQLELPVLSESRLSFFAEVGLGATRMRSNEPGQLRSGSDSYVHGTFLSGVSGLTVRYRFTDAVGAYVGARYFKYVTSADNLTLDQAVNPGRLLNTSSWTFPFTFGFQINFN
jgi:hypothetical protein